MEKSTTQRPRTESGFPARGAALLMATSLAMIGAQSATAYTPVADDRRTVDSLFDKLFIITEPDAPFADFLYVDDDPDRFQLSSVSSSGFAGEGRGERIGLSGKFFSIFDLTFSIETPTQIDASGYIADSTIHIYNGALPVEDQVLLLEEHSSNPMTSGRDYSFSRVLDPGLYRIVIENSTSIVYNSGPNWSIDATFTDIFADSDSDGIPDTVDNCTQVANPDQIDTNSDGFGNLCDTDLNNDGVTNVADLALLRIAFIVSTNADADFNGDGFVNVIDLGILRAFFFQAPGPSGLVD